MSEHYFPCGHKIVLGHTCPVCVNAALIEALRAVEWVVVIPALGAGSGRWCPSCREWDADGHTPDCQLAAALRAAEPAEEREKGEG